MSPAKLRRPRVWIGQLENRNRLELPALVTARGHTENGTVMAAPTKQHVLPFFSCKIIFLLSIVIHAPRFQNLFRCSCHVVWRCVAFNQSEALPIFGKPRFELVVFPAVQSRLSVCGALPEITFISKLKVRDLSLLIHGTCY